MRTTRQLNITLPLKIAETLRERVAAGEYASESEAICDGLRTLFARDQAVETWLSTEVADAYDALAADPDRVIDAGSARQHLAAEHADPRALHPDWRAEH